MAFTRNKRNEPYPMWVGTHNKRTVMVGFPNGLENQPVVSFIWCGGSEEVPVAVRVKILAKFDAQMLKGE